MPGRARTPVAHPGLTPRRARTAAAPASPTRRAPDPCASRRPYAPAAFSYSSRARASKTTAVDSVSVSPPLSTPIRRPGWRASR